MGTVRRAATWGRPYGVFRTGSDGSAKSGAVVESQRRQFLHTQAPVGREESQTATQICAPEGFCLTEGVTLVTGARG